MLRGKASVPFAPLQGTTGYADSVGAPCVDVRLLHNVEAGQGEGFLRILAWANGCEPAGSYAHQLALQRHIPGPHCCGLGVSTLPKRTDAARVKEEECERCWRLQMAESAEEAARPGLWLSGAGHRRPARGC